MRRSQSVIAYTANCGTQWSYARREHPGLETVIIQLTELIDRTTSRSEGSVLAPRLFGVLAGVLADGTLETHLTMACFEDDDAVAFAVAALHEGQELLFPAGPPEQA